MLALRFLFIFFCRELSCAFGGRENALVGEHQERTVGVADGVGGDAARSQRRCLTIGRTE